MRGINTVIGFEQLPEGLEQILKAAGYVRNPDSTDNLFAHNEYDHPQVRYPSFAIQREHDTNPNWEDTERNIIAELHIYSASHDHWQFHDQLAEDLVKQYDAIAYECNADLFIDRSNYDNTHLVIANNESTAQLQ